MHDYDAIPDDAHHHTYRGMIYDLDQLVAVRAVDWWLADRFVIIGLLYIDFWRSFCTISVDTITYAASINLVWPTAIRHGIALPIVK